MPASVPRCRPSHSAHTEEAAAHIDLQRLNGQNVDSPTLHHGNTKAPYDGDAVAQLQEDGLPVCVCTVLYQVACKQPADDCHTLHAHARHACDVTCVYACHAACLSCNV